MRQLLNFNENWTFQEHEGAEKQQVSLPHTPRIEPPENPKPFQAECVYEKVFQCPAEWLENRVAIRFEAVMQKCRVYVNGRQAAEHFGGYLPFTVELNDYLHPGENKILVFADNRDDKAIPPGKPTTGLDFVYYGGIYRNVYLIITPKLYLSDPVACGVVHGGGLLIETKSITQNAAEVYVKATFANTSEREAGFTAGFTVKNGDTIIAQQEKQCAAPVGNVAAEHTFHIQNPLLWDPNEPNLYTLECNWTWEGGTYTHAEAFGIRTVQVTREGFLLNGRAVYLYGVNRHQQYPYVGQAASDNAQRREARLLKSMGINTVRLSHYPQSPAFLDECDKIGLLLIEPIPGWQFCQRGTFKKRMLQNVRDMVRRDRNHPSVVVFEVSPNETPFYLPGASDKFFRSLKKAAKEELPSCVTSGDSEGRKRPLKIGYDIPHTGESKDGKDPLKGRLTLTREYGDWAFGGNHSSSRVKRGDGELAQQIQAWNFQWSHNNNLLTNNLLGDLVWEGIDHVRGYFPEQPVSTSGVLDIFRLPKFSFYFYSSQRDDEAVLFPAVWTLKNKKKIPVYSNCDVVEVWDGENLLAAQECDRGPTVFFDETRFKKTNDNYWMTDENQITVSQDVSDLGRHTAGCLYDGGNCEKVKHPPFTFHDLPLDGIEKLTFIGKREGKGNIRYEFLEPGAPVGLKIEKADFGLPLSVYDNDFVFVYVSVIDKNGVTVPAAEVKITLNAENGFMIGPAERKSEAGVAAFLLSASHKGGEQIYLKAFSEGLKCVEFTVNCMN